MDLALNKKRKSVRTCLFGTGRHNQLNISTMKTMTCIQLGGACELEFQAETFEEMVEKSKNHGMEMFQKGDKPHLQAMNEMREMMQRPGAVTEWFELKKQEFEDL